MALSAIQAIILCLVCLAQRVESAALTTTVAPHSRSCFYAWVDQKYEKVGFYFGVQRGGDFDIEYSVTSPSNVLILEGQSTTSEDLVFTANEFGEFSFCFENFVSSYGEKTVSFERIARHVPQVLQYKRLTAD